jgi:hypothetical protein
MGLPWTLSVVRVAVYRVAAPYRSIVRGYSRPMVTARPDAGPLSCRCFRVMMRTSHNEALSRRKGEAVMKAGRSYTRSTLGPCAVCWDEVKPAQPCTWSHARRTWQHSRCEVEPHAAL